MNSLQCSLFSRRNSIRNDRCSSLHFTDRCGNEHLHEIRADFADGNPLFGYREATVKPTHSSWTVAVRQQLLTCRKRDKSANAVTDRISATPRLLNIGCKSDTRLVPVMLSQAPNLTAKSKTFVTGGRAESMAG